MGDGGGCEVGYGYMHNSPFNPPALITAFSRSQRRKIDGIEGGRGIIAQYRKQFNAPGTRIQAVVEAGGFWGGSKVLRSCAADRKSLASGFRPQTTSQSRLSHHRIFC